MSIDTVYTSIEVSMAANVVRGWGFDSGFHPVCSDPACSPHASGVS